MCSILDTIVWIQIALVVAVFLLMCWRENVMRRINEGCVHLQALAMQLDEKTAASRVMADALEAERAARGGLSP